MKAMQKTTLREIKDTLGRFLAILSIIALGVGFFSGVKITTPAMIHTVDIFLQEKQFYDYRLLSTLGWEDQDVEAFRSQPDVRYAEGSNTLDVLYLANDTEVVFKTHSLPENINQIQIEEGRLPVNENECLADAGQGNLQIGDIIIVADDNEQDTKDALKYKELEVVGLAYSSYYINFERGSTSIGNGSVEGYVYILPEAFDLEYYNEIFIRFNQDYEIYSQEYQDYMAEKDTVWEDLTQQQAENRYDRIIADAEEELQDGKDELEEKRQEGEEELADAQQELEDAQQELSDAEQELSDAAQQLADGKAELDDAQQELADGKVELDDAQQELADGRTELDNVKQQLDDAKQQLDAAEQQLLETEQQLTDAAQQLEDSKKVLDDSQTELNASRQILQDGQTQIQDAQAQIDTALASLNQSQKELQAQEAELNQSQEELDAQMQLWDYLTEEQQQALLTAQSQINAAWEEINAAKEQLTSGFQQLYAQQSAVNEKSAEIAAGLQALEAGQNEWNAGVQQYEAGLQDYENGLEEYEAGLEEYTAGFAEYEAGLEAYQQAEKTYQEGLEEYESGKQAYEEGLEAYEEGKQTYEESLQKYQDGLAEYEDGKQKYLDGLAEYEDGKQEFDEKIADAQQEIADAEQEIADIEKPDSYMLDRSTNLGYACFESDSEIVGQVAKVFPVFFILVAALVCMTTMSRMVEEQRTQIGTLKALGYSVSAIMRKFMFYSGTASLLGCVFGYIVGTIVFPEVIWMTYGMMYMPLPMPYLFDAQLAVGSLLVCLLCSVGTTWISCHYELAETAAGLMRPKAPKAGKRVFLEYFPFIWNHMKFLHKVSIRNIFRYKRRFLMMVIGISGCTALLLTGFGLYDSSAGFAEIQYTEILTADASASLKSGMGQELSEDLKQLLDEQTESYIPIYQASWDLVTKEKTKSIYLLAPFDDMDGYMNFHTLKGESIVFPTENEAIISNSVSERFGVSVGDDITLRNEDMQELHLTITAVFENHVYDYICISPETISNQISEQPEYNTIYMNFMESTDQLQAAAVISSHDDVSVITVFETLKERMTNMMNSLAYVIMLVIFSAGSLAFIVIYNLTNINITERIREIATIKVLGFFKRETSAYVLRENIALTAIGIITGLILGIFLHRFVMQQIVVDSVSFKVRILPMSYAYSIILTFVFNGIVNLFMGRKLDHINMAESLKSVD